MLIGIPVMSLILSVCTRSRFGRYELLLPTYCCINIAILQSDSVPGIGLHISVTQQIAAKQNSHEHYIIEHDMTTIFTSSYTRPLVCISRNYMPVCIMQSSRHCP